MNCADKIYLDRVSLENIFSLVKSTKPRKKRLLISLVPCLFFFCDPREIVSCVNRKYLLNLYEKRLLISLVPCLFFF